VDPSDTPGEPLERRSPRHASNANKNISAACALTSRLTAAAAPAPIAAAAAAAAAAATAAAATHGEQTAIAFEYNNEFGKYLSSRMHHFNGSGLSGEAVSAVQGKLEAVKGVMVQNIEV
jgi:hypothetical protein